jgi:hypothetical protein
VDAVLRFCVYVSKLILSVHTSRRVATYGKNLVSSSLVLTFISLKIYELKTNELLKEMFTK